MLVLLSTMAVSHAAPTCSTGSDAWTQACSCIKLALTKDPAQWNDQLVSIAPGAYSAAVGSCFDYGWSSATATTTTQRLLVGAGESMLDTHWSWIYSGVVGDSTVMLDMLEHGGAWGWYPVPTPNTWELRNQQGQIGATLQSEMEPTGAYFTDVNDDGLLELVVGLQYEWVEVFDGGFDPHQPLIVIP
ncbi:MAG: hypothetical protein H6738_22330 [Alphaproteobacteria bacterium]|nr:hypothetical protein [Alphaproteobacteria bacterium]MCB9699538.1 hypothetical protein [Alphaproteobacteria bacterium]